MTGQDVVQRYVDMHNSWEIDLIEVHVSLSTFHVEVKAKEFDKHHILSRRMHHTRDTHTHPE